MQNDFSLADVYTSQLSDGDSLNDEQYRELADLIFDTDPYIYPVLFSGKEPKIIARNVLPYVFQSGKDGMFSLNNIFACFHLNRMIGIVLWKKGKITWDSNLFIQLANSVGTRLDSKNVEIVKKEYISKQYSDSIAENMISILNVCVASEYRSKGVGDLLIRNFVSAHEKDDFELCVLCDNAAAICLYRRNGFVIVDKYEGFSMNECKPMCYEMTRVAKDNDESNGM